LNTTKFRSTNRAELLIQSETFLQTSFMAFFDCHFFSDTLGLSVSAYILLPQATTRQIGIASGEARREFPTLYLLHGLSDDHTIWMRRTAIERYAAAKNIAVVMPAVERSFYHDMARGPCYWTYLVDELPNICRQFFPLSSAREDTFAAGLSMGGYGALRLGFKKPERFAAVASLSGAFDVARRARNAERSESLLSSAEMRAIFGERSLDGSESDLFFLAENVAAVGKRRPAIFLACGTEDELIEENRRMHQHLDNLQIPHRYAESPGAHEWSYWDAQIAQVLDWLPLRS
jgi:putative tributyrin esterase